MELMKLNGYGADVVLLPSDCAALAEICRRVDDVLGSEEDAQLQIQARMLETTFRALTVAAMTLGSLAPADREAMAAELTTLGLGGLMASKG